MSHTAFIALGANLGQPLPTLRWARDEVSKLGQIVAVSRLYRTAPVGGPPGQPDYLNAALRLDTRLSASELLTALHDIEAHAGRERNVRWEARVLDLDLILFDSLILDDWPLLPHPRAWERAFVLAPLADLDLELANPRTGESVADALARVGTAGTEVLLQVW